MLPLAEVQDVLERTERLAVRSAFALCLAFEMMQRSGIKSSSAVSDLQTLRAEIDRVSEALGDILANRAADREAGPPLAGVERLH